MARLERPVDLYGMRKGAVVEVQPNDENPDLRQLVNYARNFGARVWRFPNDQLGITSKYYDNKLGRENAPLLFGGEGRTIGQTAMEAFSALFNESHHMPGWLRLH